MHTAGIADGIFFIFFKFCLCVHGHIYSYYLYLYTIVYWANANSTNVCHPAPNLCTLKLLFVEAKSSRALPATAICSGGGASPPPPRLSSRRGQQEGH